MSCGRILIRSHLYIPIFLFFIIDGSELFRLLETLITDQKVGPLSLFFVKCIVHVCQI
jgi:hypothetical protein